LRSKKVTVMMRIMTARPVTIHMPTKMVDATWSATHVHLVTSLSHSRIGNATCVIQHKQIKCAGSTMNMSPDIALI